MTKARHDIDTFSTLVESIYDSAFDARNWEIFLGGLAEALNAKSGLFRVVDERTRTLRTGIYHNLDNRLQEAYQQYFVARDPIVEALTRAPDVYIAPGEAFLDSEAYRRTEFFNEYARPQDNYYICGGLAMRNSEFTIKFGVQRDRRTGPFSWADAGFIQRLVPHIQRSARLGHLLRIAGARAASGDRALESMAVAVVLLDERRRALSVNAKAEEMLHAGEGLTQKDGVLCADHPANGKTVDDLLSVTIRRARAAGPAAPEAALLRHPTEDKQRLVVALPITDIQRDFVDPWPTASIAVFICSLEEAGLLNQEVLCRLYGLTQREAELSIALSHGKSLPEIAGEWGISTETLRTHLKRILGKTGTARQAELVRLLTGKPWNLMSDPCPVPRDGNRASNEVGALAADPESQ